MQQAERSQREERDEIMSGLGWIKLHRKIFDSAVNSLPTNQKWIMITLLLMANHEEKGWMWEGQNFKCLPGQFVTSLDSISEKSGESIRSVRTALKNLEKLGFLTNKSTKTGRLITIENWRKYQIYGDETDKDIDKASTNERQTSDRRPTANKNEIIKECNNESSSSSYIPTSYKAEEETDDATPPPSDLITHFRKCGFLVNDYSKDYVADFVEQYGEVWCRAAMTRAMERGKPNIGYLEGILKDWKNSGDMDSGARSAEDEAEKKKVEKEKNKRLEKQHRDEWNKYLDDHPDENIGYYDFRDMKGWKV